VLKAEIGAILRLAIGNGLITGGDWYRHLSRIKPDEVNFWQPSASVHFRALDLRN
jgi:hypothetical protein